MSVNDRNSKIDWHFISFDDLTRDQLYNVLALRAEVFTLEQRCFALDPDGLDRQAIHVMGMQGDNLVAVARILPPNVYEEGVVSFGRLALRKHLRGQGNGKQMMDVILDYMHEHYVGIPIQSSMQDYLAPFYKTYGFRVIGERYDVGGIPHKTMVLDR